MASSTSTEGRRTEPGPTGNERLTAITGAVLFVLLAAEGVTILDLRPLFNAHVFIGTLIIGPVLLKLGSTGYRFLRYYTGSSPYRSKGPPQPLMRMLAPPLVLVTLVLLASGIVLMMVDPGHPGPWLVLHKASFVIWIGLASIHVAFYVWRVPGLMGADVRRRPGPASTDDDVPGCRTRMMLTVAGLAAGALAGALVTPLAQPWVHWMSLRR
jgi:hypothetical protein